MTKRMIIVKIIEETRAVVTEFIENAKLKAGDIVVIGCSSSEVTGGVIGKSSSPETGKVLFETINDVLSEHGISIAAQCCEHLNRALIVERETALKYGLEMVSVVPFAKAGGSFATAAYGAMKNPVAVEFIKADAGIDIGDTLIGMHLKHVAVPVRVSQKTIGQANVVCARTRPKLIGGERAHYDENML